MDENAGACVALQKEIASILTQVRFQSQRLDTVAAAATTAAAMSPGARLYLCVHVCVCVCVCMCVCVYIYPRIFIHKYIHTYTHTYI